MRWEHLRSVIARHSKGYQGIKKLVPHILHIRRETPTTQPSGERVSSIEVSVKLCWQLDNCMKNPPTGRLHPLRITPRYCIREGMDSKEKERKEMEQKPHIPACFLRILHLVPFLCPSQWLRVSDSPNSFDKRRVTFPAPKVANTLLIPIWQDSQLCKHYVPTIKSRSLSRLRSAQELSEGEYVVRTLSRQRQDVEHSSTDSGPVFLQASNVRNSTFKTALSWVSSGFWLCFQMVGRYIEAWHSTPVFNRH